jgi:hypothetical protein
MIRSIHRMIIIQRILNDTQRENQYMEMNQRFMLVRDRIKDQRSSQILCLFLIDSQNGGTWLPPPPPSTYLPNDLASNHGPFTDATGACLPSMASFRSQQQATYASNGNEQTVQTGETLGKALQSV